MTLLLKTLGRWIGRFRQTVCPPDILSTLNLHDYADLPPYHPERDCGC